MLVEIGGLQQGSIEVELNIIPRQGEILKVMYGADAEIEGEVLRLNTTLINMRMSIRSDLRFAQLTDETMIKKEFQSECRNVVSLKKLMWLAHQHLVKPHFLVNWQIN